MSSKTEKRAKEILRLLLQQGRTSVEELTASFATSPASIRRDLVRLEEQGLVHRTHGGAMLAGQVYEPFRFDASFQEREERFKREKQRIAALAADLAGANETIGVTAGTTTTQVARALRGRAGLHIFTNAVNIGMELSAGGEGDVTLTGGCMRWPGAFSLVGPAALETIQLAHFDTVFLGVCGISAQHGASTIQAEEAAVFRAMCRHAKRVVVVADSSKLGMVSPALICPPTAIDVLVTDDGINEEAVHSFEQSGIRLMIAR